MFLVKQRNACYLKRQVKFGIKLLNSVKEAIKFVKENSNTFWQNTTAKNMEKVQGVFDILYDKSIVPNGHQFVKSPIVFDIKTEDFRRKARLVAGDQMT